MRISLRQSLTAVILLLLVCLGSEGWLAHTQLKGALPGRWRCSATGCWMLETERLRLVQEQKDCNMADGRAHERNAIADRFQARMGSLADRFATSSDEVAAAARNLSATAEQTSRQAETVTAAAEGASGNVQTVAAAAEELSASIQEMSQQITASADIARNASEEAERTTASIGSLSTTANGIGDVV